MGLTPEAILLRRGKRSEPRRVPALDRRLQRSPERDPLVGDPARALQTRIRRLAPSRLEIAMSRSGWFIVLAVALVAYFVGRASGPAAIVVSRSE